MGEKERERGNEEEEEVERKGIAIVVNNYNS